MPKRYWTTVKPSVTLSADVVLDETRFEGDNTLKGYENDPDLQDFLMVVQSCLRVSIAIDDAFPDRPAFKKLIK